MSGREREGGKGVGAEGLRHVFFTGQLAREYLEPSPHLLQGDCSWTVEWGGGGLFFVCWLLA